MKKEGFLLPLKSVNSGYVYFVLVYKNGVFNKFVSNSSFILTSLGYS